MQTNYLFNVNENIKRLITDCLQELAAMDIPVATSIFFREAKGRTYYGTCYRGRRTKRYADYVNSRTDYNVTRTATHTLAPQPQTRRRRRVRAVRFR